MMRGKSILKCIVVMVLFMIISILLLPNQVKAASDSNPDKSVMKFIREGLDARKEKNMVEGTMPSRGNAHLLVIDLITEGTENQLSTEHINDLLFGDYYSNGSSVRDENLTDYFRNISYGKLNVTGEVVGYEIESGKVPLSDDDIKQILDDVLENRVLEDFDKNVDSYLDGIIILYPDSYNDGKDAHVSHWNYQYKGYKSANLTLVECYYKKNVHTIAHETVHMMGLPDIYANVGINREGTCADTLMDGLRFGWDIERGTINANIPGIMKFFYGWIDNLQEVCTDGTYTLSSYSKNSNAMVIYPEGDSQSQFFFFVEFVTAEGNDIILKDTSYFEDGLRIWKVYLCGGDAIVNQEWIGGSISPYDYLEALNVNGQPYMFNEGQRLSASSLPSTIYHTQFEETTYYSEYKQATYERARCPIDNLDSGIVISNYRKVNGTASFDIKFNDSEKINPEISFVESQSVVSYTGEAIELSDDIVKATENAGDITFEFFINKDCTIPTFKGDNQEGSAPSKAGVYYVKAMIEGNEVYNSATTNEVFVLTIRPRKVASASVANMKSSIKLTWTGRPEADGYNVYRRNRGTNSNAYELIGSVTADEVLSYTDTDIKQGIGYIYTIRAYSDAADGTEVEGLMMGAAKKIIRTKVTSITNQNGSVKVKWTKIADADGYKVYRKCSGEDSYKRIKTIKDSSVNYYVDKADKILRNGKASYYYVKPYYEEENGYVLTTDKKTNYYVIRPAISSLTASSKAFTVKWNKNSSASGYQIRYSTSSSFDDYTTVTVSGKARVSKKISDLTKNKKYYVKIRTYKTYNGMKYYSAWSGYKSVKTK